MTEPPALPPRDRANLRLGREAKDMILDVEELAEAAGAEIEGTPTRRTVAQLLVAVVVGLVAVALLALMGSQWIWWMAELFQPNCTSLSGPFCGGFFEFWNGPDSDPLR